MLDSLIADLIASALLPDRKEVDDFVGIDGDGRSPLGSFSARIQGAYLMRLISKEQLDVLRALKDVRNVFSHRALASFADPKVVAKSRRIFEVFRDNPPPRKKDRVYPTDEEFASAFESRRFDPEACFGLYLGAAMIQIKAIRNGIRQRRRRRKP